jgi:Proteasomal ATPase OB N-terminal domain
MSPGIDSHHVRPGQELILNEGLNVIETAEYEIQGEDVVLKGQLHHERALVTLRADEEKIGIITEPLRSIWLHPGDHILGEHIVEGARIVGIGRKPGLGLERDAHGADRG